MVITRRMARIFQIKGVWLEISKKKRSMARSRKYDAASRKSCGGGVSWSDLNLDVLYSIMMLLGVVDFFSFSRVCKRWSSLAGSYINTFMASKPPMLLRYDKNDCYLHDFEGRKFKTIIPQLEGRTCVGFSCGYLILLGLETRDFWLVNPITRHQLHFPDIPLEANYHLDRSFHVKKAILVFSPPINEWVFAMLNKPYNKVWFSVARTGAWNYVSENMYIFVDLHAFKGKIYTLNCASLYGNWKHVRELRLDPVPTSVCKFTLPDTLFTYPRLTFEFISSDENLYLMEYTYANTYNVFKLDFDQLNCVPCEKSTQEYAFFTSDLRISAAVKSGPWAASLSAYCEHRFPHLNKRGKGGLYIANFWYFPHQCLNVSILDK